MSHHFPLTWCVAVTTLLAPPTTLASEGPAPPPTGLRERDASVKKAKPASIERRLKQQLKRRNQLLATAERFGTAAGIEAKSDWLDAEAQRAAEPDLHLFAAEAALELGPSPSALARAAQHIEAAAIILDGQDWPAWLDSREAERLRGIAAHLTVRLEAGRAELKDVELRRQAEKVRGEAAARQIQRGREEMIAGGVLMVLSLTSIGVALGGANFERQYRAVIRNPALSDYDLSPIESLHSRGQTMLVGGAVGGILFAAAGIPLLALGGRDLKLGRKGLERPPTIGLEARPGALSLRLNF